MYEILACSFLSLVLYWNTLHAGFAYDDSRAVLKNQDLLPTTPLANIWRDDFWGTPLNHSGSHKSYRPLCTLSFRLNHAVGGLDPFTYHLGNVLLHCLVTAIFTHTAKGLFKNTATSCLAGALFACHPIHTEAVAGIVGRADIGAALFFLLSFLSYGRYCSLRRDGGRVTQSFFSESSWLICCGVCAALSMLSKEQGITVLALNGTFDLFICHRISLKGLSRIFVEKRYSPLRRGIMSQVLTALILVTLRLSATGWSPPTFAPADNPAADSDDLLTRTLTFLYLPTANFWLLVCPYKLSFDWSMGAVPLIESICDWRNLYSLAFYSSLIFIGTKIVGGLQLVTMVAVSSDNHANNFRQHSRYKLKGELNDNYSIGNGCPGKYFDGKITGGKTVLRGHRLNNGLNKSNNGFGKSKHINNDYHHSAINSTTQNGYSTNQEATSNHVTDSNDGRVSNHATNSNHLMNNGQPEMVEMRRTLEIVFTSFAFLVFPFVPATNLFFYVGFVIAERILYIPSMGFCLLLAFGIEKLFRSYHGYRARQVAISCLTVLLLSAFSLRTVLRNQDWFNEETLYRSGITVNPPKAWGNLANILKMDGKLEEAEVAYRNALKHRGNMADVHYNLGILLQESGRFDDAILSYQNAIRFRPRLSMAHLNLGIVLSEVGRVREAELVYRHASTLTDDGLKDPRNQIKGVISSMFNLGRLLQDQGRYKEALEVYQQALQRRPDFYAPQSLYNMLGETHYHLSKLQEAELWYKKSLESKPDHVPAHLTYANLLSKTKRVLQAESLLKRAMDLEPDNANVYRHYGQLLNEHGRHRDASDYYLQAFNLRPDDFEVAFNLANALRQAGDSESSEQYYLRASELKPHEAHAHMNLGAILHMNNKLEAAERSYLRALEIEPDHKTTAENLKKLRSLMEKRESAARR